MKSPEIEKFEQCEKRFFELNPELDPTGGYSPGFILRSLKRIGKIVQGKNIVKKNIIAITIIEALIFNVVKNSTSNIWLVILVAFCSVPLAIAPFFIKEMLAGDIYDFGDIGAWVRGCQFPYSTTRLDIAINQFPKDWQIINVVGTKPGIGKSSMAAIAANFFVGKGKTVALVDCDVKRKVKTENFLFAPRDEVKRYSVEEIKTNEDVLSNFDYIVNDFGPSDMNFIRELAKQDQLLVFVIPMGKMHAKSIECLKGKSNVWFIINHVRKPHDYVAGQYYDPNFDYDDDDDYDDE